MINFVASNPDTRVVLGDDPRLLPLLTSDPNNRIYNLFGLYNIGTMLYGLAPNVDIWHLGELDFYTAYRAFIWNSPDAFFSLMRVMMDDYEGHNVYIITNLDHDVISTMVECISEYYQERYGFECGFIYSIEDIEYIEEGEVTYEHMNTFMADKEYYIRNTTNPQELMQQIYSLEDSSGNTI